jgi:hypothetical protein
MFIVQGIFNVWQLKSLSPIFTSSMLWKPVVYQQQDRSIEQSTLMKIYPLKTNIVLQSTIDRGIFNAFYKEPYVSALNISLGRTNDGQCCSLLVSNAMQNLFFYITWLGFFTKTNYTFIQLTAGLDIIQLDSTKNAIVLALIVTLALPSLVASIAFLAIVKRRCTIDRQNDDYDSIDDWSNVNLW